MIVTLSFLIIIWQSANVITSAQSMITAIAIAITTIDIITNPVLVWTLMHYM